MKKHYSLNPYMPVLLAVSQREQEKFYLDLQNKLTPALAGYFETFKEYQEILVKERGKDDDVPKSNAKTFFNLYFNDEDIHNEKISSTQRKTDEKKMHVIRKRINQKFDSINIQCKIEIDFVISVKRELNLSRMVNRAGKLVANKKFKTIKLFDFYSERDKDMLFKYRGEDTYLKNFLLEMAIQGCHIDIITGLGTEGSKRFYHKLLKDSEIKGIKQLNVTYVGKKKYSFSSLIYALLKEDNGDCTILYFEKATKWVVAKTFKCNQENIEKDDFIHTFWKLLIERFDSHSNGESQKDIIRMENPTLVNKNFDNELQKIVKQISNLICNYREDGVHDILKVISFLDIHTTKHTITLNMLKSSVEFIDKIAKLNNNEISESEKRQIKNAVLILHKNNIFTDVRKVTSALKNIGIDSFSEAVYDSAEEDLHISIHTKQEFQKKSLSELFETLVWNSKETVIKAMNKILSDPEKLIKLLQNTQEYQNEEQITKLPHKALIYRAYQIFSKVYGIDIPSSIHYSDSE